MIRKNETGWGGSSGSATPRVMIAVIVIFAVPVVAFLGALGYAVAGHIFS